MVILHLPKGDLQMVFQGIEAIKDAVVERLLAQFIPEMFNGIEFG
jgi:hypothetical protein